MSPPPIVRSAGVANGSPVAPAIASATAAAKLTPAPPKQNAPRRARRKRQRAEASLALRTPLEHLGDTGVARSAGRLHAPEVVLPQRCLVDAEVVQVLPRIDAGVVAVRKEQIDAVKTDRLGGIDQHLTLADLQHFLPGSVAAHFGRRRIDAQELERQLEMRTVRERDLHLARGLMDLDVGGGGDGHV